MNNLLIGALVLLLLALGWSLWRYFAMRRAVEIYTRTIQRLDAQAFPPTDLPTDFPELELSLDWSEEESLGLGSVIGATVILIVA